MAVHSGFSEREVRIRDCWGKGLTLALHLRCRGLGGHSISEAIGKLMLFSTKIPCIARFGFYLSKIYKIIEKRQI